MIKPVGAYSVSSAQYSIDNGATTPTPTQLSQLELQLDKDIKELETAFERADITNPEAVARLGPQYKHVIEEAGALGFDPFPIRRAFVRMFTAKSTKETRAKWLQKWLQLSH